MRAEKGVRTGARGRGLARGCACELAHTDLPRPTRPHTHPRPRPLLLCTPRQALIHGLNRHYYSIAINYRKNALEQKMLLNLHKSSWTGGLSLNNFETHDHLNQQSVTVRPRAGTHNEPRRAQKSG